MSSPHATSTSANSSGNGSPASSEPMPGSRLAPDELACLAHELRSLLDGSLRSLGLIRLAMDEATTTPEPITRWLEAARLSMNSMAELLASATGTRRADFEAYRSTRTLQQEFQRTMLTLRSAVDELGVRVVSNIQPAAAALPAGLLAHVMVNGLRNALNAVANAPPHERTITFTATIEPAENLRLRIIDSGSGVNPDDLPATPDADGHGIGLVMSSSLVDRLDGRLTLGPNPSGRGAVFEVNVAVESLNEP